MKHSFFEKNGSTYVVFSHLLPARENNYSHEDVNIELLFEVNMWAFKDEAPYVTCDMKIDGKTVYSIWLNETMKDGKHVLDELCDKIEYDYERYDDSVHDWISYENVKAARYFAERLYGYINNDDIRQYILCHIGI